jgi:hypothetical protein
VGRLLLERVLLERLQLERLLLERLFVERLFVERQRLERILLERVQLERLQLELEKCALSADGGTEGTRRETKGGSTPEPPFAIRSLRVRGAPTVDT